MFILSSKISIALNIPRCIDGSEHIWDFVKWKAPLTFSIGSTVVLGTLMSRMESVGCQVWSLAWFFTLPWSKIVNTKQCVNQGVAYKLYWRVISVMWAKFFHNLRPIFKHGTTWDKPFTYLKVQSLGFYEWYGFALIEYQYVDWSPFSKWLFENFHYLDQKSLTQNDVLIKK